MKTTRTIFKTFLVVVLAVVAGGVGYGQVDVNSNIAYTQNFDAMGSGNSLPANWRISPETAIPVWSTAASSTSQESSSGSPTTGGTYNWGESAIERSVGAMTSGTFASPNSILAWYRNTSYYALTGLSISYKAERYRTNTASASIQFYYSLDGSNWTAVTSGDIATTSFPTGTSAYSFASPLVVSVSSFLVSGLSIDAGASFYLRWNINTTGSNSQGIGIDDISVTPTFTVLPTNVVNGGVNWVGSNQGYIQPTNCNGTSPFVMKYRRVATASSNPTDGRGQWFTSLNAQASGGDVLNSNMTGGSGSGFLFTNGNSCGSGGGWDNKWVFGGVGQAGINQVNGNNYYTSGGSDMGLNMSTAGYYNFCFKDVGNSNSSFYVGYTSSPPVTILHNASSQTELNYDYSLTVNATLSATPSTEEKFYLRYRVGTNDFTLSTTIVQGSVVGTNATFTIPTQAISSTINYYIFSSTISLANMNALNAGDRSLACLKYADNANANYSFTIPLPTTYTWVGTGTGSWTNTANWSPSAIPTNGDNVVFNNAAAVVVTNVPNINLSTISCTNAGSVTWQSNADVSFNVGFSGASNPVMSLATGKQFSFSGSANAISLNIKTGFSASIFGTVTFGDAAHRLYAENANAISFESGSLFVASSGFTGNAFGSSGVKEIVVFKSGSTYEYLSGSNPFGFGQPESKVIFSAGSLYKHSSTNYPSFSGRTYANILVTSAAGASLNNITGIYGYSVDNLTLETGVTFSLNLSGTCSVKGNIAVPSGATLSFNPIVATTVNINGSSVQSITGSGNILLGDNTNLNVVASSTLNCGTSNITGTGTFTLSSGGTLGIGSDKGITTAPTASGNIQTTNRNFSAGGNYIYNGATLQATGNALPSTITGYLTIANTGTIGNQTVSLTNNNTTLSTLNLNGGYFSIGSTYKVYIADNGIVTKGSGDFTNSNNAGTLHFVDNGTISGTPYLWNVISEGDATVESGTDGVQFLGNATINNQFEIKQQGLVRNDAPRYGAASTLIYSSGGDYSRSLEWSNFSGNPGYPHHVKLINGTKLYMNDRAIYQDSIVCGGNLNLGDATTVGELYMTGTLGNMTKYLSVVGNLTIGDLLNASATSKLNLSGAIGGDLWLHGNFTRYTGSQYNDNSRAIFFKGSTNSVVEVLPTPSATPPPPVTTHQNFSYAYIDKTVGTATVTLDCAVGINNQIGFTKGVVVSTSGTPLVVYNINATAVTGGDGSSYVDGPMIRKVGTLTGDYWFPVGKSSATAPYRGMAFRPTANAGSYFMSEYFPENPPDQATDAFFASTLMGIQKNEYWQFDKLDNSTEGKIIVAYVNPGDANWRTYNGAILPPCSNCNVAVVKRSTTTGAGIWDFPNATAVSFASGGSIPEYRSYLNNGEIISKTVTSYSPFTIGYSYNTILGALPVKMLRFDAKLINADAHLQWSIDSDKDLLSFEIQHSTNGTQFIAIGTLSPAGKQYAFVHSKPLPGKHFYRLLVKEKAGNYYSKTIVVVVGNSSTIITGLQSTVVQQILVANIWSGSAQKVEATITDMSGKLLTKQSGQLLPGQNMFKIPVANWAKGLYHVTLHTADGIGQTIKWMKE